MTTVVKPSFSFRWKTPDGPTTIFITNEEHPEVQIFIGKAGGSVGAFAYALAGMTTLALKSNTLEEVIQFLSDISSDRATFIAPGVACRSTAEALSFALLEFRRVKGTDSRRSITVSS